MSEKRAFGQLTYGERFIHRNKECVKLYEDVRLAYTSEVGSGIRANAVELDQGQLIFIAEWREVIYLSRSY